MKLRSTIVAASLGLLTVLANGCDKDDPVSVSAPTTAKVVVMNAVPTDQAYDVTISGQRIASGLLFNQVSSDYTTINAGAVVPSIVNAGGALVTSASLQYNAGLYYSVYVAGSPTNPIIFTKEDVITTLPADSAHVRVLNLVTNGLTRADVIQYSEDGTSIADTSFAGKFNFGDFSYGGTYRNFAPTTAVYQIISTWANVDVKTPKITLSAGKNYTLVLSGDVNGTGNKGVQMKVLEHPARK